MQTYRRSIDNIVRICTSSKYFTMSEQDPRWQAFLGLLSRKEHAANAASSSSSPSPPPPSAGAGVPPQYRHTALALRRLGWNIEEAQTKKRLCLYCWVPKAACFCDAIRCIPRPDVSSSSSCADSIAFHSAAAAVYLLHPEEFLKVTNSGHIAAMTLDAPLVLWGLPQHNEVLRLIAELHVAEYALFCSLSAESTALGKRNGSSSSSSSDDDEDQSKESSPRFFPPAVLEQAGRAGSNFASLFPTPPSLEQVQRLRTGALKQKPIVGVLYPSEQAIPLEQFVAEATSRNPPRSNDDRDTTEQQPEKEHDAQPQKEKATETLSSPIVLILLDSTWPQARALARHLPANCPRIVIQLDDKFGRGRFASLRKRTRQDGCSTLEASAMAISQLLAACYPPSFSAHQQQQQQLGQKDDDAVVTESKAAEVVATLASRIENMLIFNFSVMIDIVVMVKHVPQNDAGGIKEHVYSADPEIVALVRRAKEGYRVHTNERHADAVAKREVMSVAEMVQRGIMMPPVARFCYLCNCATTMSRVEAHCSGAAHLEMFHRKMEQAKAQIVLQQTQGGDSSKEKLTEPELYRQCLQMIWRPTQEAFDYVPRPSRKTIADHYFEAMDASGAAAAAFSNNNTD